jgi:hypothetical protein
VRAELAAGDEAALRALFATHARGGGGLGPLGLYALARAR